MDKETLDKKYNTAEITEDGFVKPNGGPQHFIQVDKDVIIHASWGEDQNIPAGGYLNITDENNIYGIEKDLFDKTYRVTGDAPLPEKEVNAHDEVGFDEL